MKSGCLVGIGVLFGLVGAGCGSSAAEAAERGAFELIRERQENLDRGLDETNLPDLFVGSLPDGPLIVEGTVVEVADGVGMYWTFDEEETEERHIVGFGDDDAEVNSVHLAIRVDQVISSGVDTNVVRGDRVVGGLTVNTADEAAVFRSDLEGETFVMVLQHSAVFDYEAGLYGFGLDGSLICRRGETTALVCPGVPSSVAEVIDLAGVTAEMLAAEPVESWTYQLNIDYIGDDYDTYDEAIIESTPSGFVVRWKPRCNPFDADVDISQTGTALDVQITYPEADACMSVPNESVLEVTTTQAVPIDAIAVTLIPVPG